MDVMPWLHQAKTDTHQVWLELTGWDMAQFFGDAVPCFGNQRCSGQIEINGNLTLKSNQFDFEKLTWQQVQLQAEHHT